MNLWCYFAIRLVSSILFCYDLEKHTYLLIISPLLAQDMLCILHSIRAKL